MSTLYNVGNPNELQEAGRFREELKVKIGRSYINGKGEPIKIVGKVTLPGWQNPLFVDPRGRRYDKLGYSYDSKSLPPAKEDLIAFAKKGKSRWNKQCQTSKKSELISLALVLRQWSGKSRKKSVLRPSLK